MNKTIKHQFTFTHSPEVVWEYLTKAELLAEWLMPNNIQPTVGHKFQLQSKPMPRFGFDGVVHCEVLEVVLHEKLVFSWKGGVLDTIVVWTLSPAKEGTLLTLEHRGFKGLKTLLPYLIMNSGWAKIGKRFLKKISQS